MCDVFSFNFSLSLSLKMWTCFDDNENGNNYSWLDMEAVGQGKVRYIIGGEMVTMSH